MFFISDIKIVKFNKIRRLLGHMKLRNIKISHVHIETFTGKGELN